MWQSNSQGSQHRMHRDVVLGAMLERLRRAVIAHEAAAAGSSGRVVESAQAP